MGSQKFIYGCEVKNPSFLENGDKHGLQGPSHMSPQGRSRRWERACRPCLCQASPGLLLEAARGLLFFNLLNKNEDYF